jgi:hypothetical protein
MAHVKIGLSRRKVSLQGRGVRFGKLLTSAQDLLYCPLV